MYYIKNRPPVTLKKHLVLQIQNMMADHQRSYKNVASEIYIDIHKQFVRTQNQKNEGDFIDEVKNIVAEKLNVSSFSPSLFKNSSPHEDSPITIMCRTIHELITTWFHDRDQFLCSLREEYFPTSSISL